MKYVTTSYGRVKGNAKKYRYWQPAVYGTRVSRGRIVATYFYHVGTARRSERLAIEDAKNFAKEKGIKYVQGMRHNQVLAPNWD